MHIIWNSVNSQILGEFKSSEKKKYFVRGVTSGERFKKNFYCSVYEFISQRKWSSSYEWIFCWYKHGCRDACNGIADIAIPLKNHGVFLVFLLLNRWTMKCFDSRMQNTWLFISSSNNMYISGKFSLNAVKYSICSKNTASLTLKLNY